MGGGEPRSGEAEAGRLGARRRSDDEGISPNCKARGAEGVGMAGDGPRSGEAEAGRLGAVRLGGGVGVGGGSGGEGPGRNEGGDGEGIGSEGAAEPGVGGSDGVGAVTQDRNFPNLSMRSLN